MQNTHPTVHLRSSRLGASVAQSVAASAPGEHSWAACLRPRLCLIHGATAVPLVRLSLHGSAASSCGTGSTLESQFVGLQPGQPQWRPRTGFAAAGNTGATPRGTASQQVTKSQMHVRQQVQSRARRRAWSARRGLTLRSSGAPTAGHQRPVGGTVYIFTARALASCRRRALNSNVRPHKHHDSTATIRRSTRACCPLEARHQP